MDLKSKLRVEGSKNCSGDIIGLNKIRQLKESNYYVIPQTLDGDAPKEFVSAYFYSKSNKFHKKNSSSWYKYIAKTAEKWYPIESITEFTINKLGETLGLKMNESELVYCNGQIRFFSKYFLKKDEILLHGAEICGDYLNDRVFANEIAGDKNTAREFFTFEFICEALDKIFKSHSFKLKLEFVRMLVFDCLIGNNDRHFYNWGVIANTRRSVKMPIFAPVYDSARGLFWNQSDEKIRHFHSLLSNPNSRKIEKYSKVSQPRVSIESNKNANHFELIEYIIATDARYKAVVIDLCSESNEREVLERFRNDCCCFMIRERQDLIEQLLKRRFKTTRELIS
ncbi:hypothetical protein G3O08_17580 [Cryomorpha ignava]|uniref:HipA-like C-terminal domain-containing protein n=1 Tax=Cryomorpha ignava TaxID=101383 RepID=A0A7K3WW86_9FLAO|nr:HipA domain-containing protein [Cryomorpha ignava]NEN25311.1 hypothetical protein [Cryomorpha ignava]